MKILLTNDDGIDAPGINALAEAVADFGDERRRLRRATIHGVTTVGADGVASRQLKPDPELQAAE